MMRITLDEERWTRKVREGARLLFWVTVLSTVLVGCVAFSLPLIGGTRRDLMWVAVIPACAGLGVAYAVFSITTSEPGGTPIRSGRRTMLRIIAGLDAVVRLGAPISMALANPANTNYFLVGKNFVRIGFACAFFLYVRSLAIRFGLGKLTRTAGTLVWLFPLSSLAMPLAFDVFGGTIQPNGLLYFCCDAILKLSVGIWALYFLWRFGNAIILAARGRCLRCGYLLAGLTECRCSECGTPFSRGWDLEFQADGCATASDGSMDAIDPAAAKIR